MTNILLLCATTPSQQLNPLIKVSTTPATMELSKVHLVSVFTASDSPETGGNLLPVVLDASALSEEDMRRIAREYGHEASFLIPLPEASSESQKADYQLRFFVPEHEMEMCGHVTVGTTWLLGELGILRDDQKEVCYSTKSGLVRARRRQQEGRILVEVSQPRGWVTPVQDEALRREIAAVLGESAGDKINTESIQNACTSRAKTVVPMRDSAALDALKPNFSRMQALCEKLGSTGLYPYAPHNDNSSNVPTRNDSLVVHARQFPKASGYPEDAATGIAAAALSFALLENNVLGEDRSVVVRQGEAMGCPSEIRVRIEFDGEEAVCWIGGTVRHVKRFETNEN